ncbi:MAG: hypothetical protein OSB72_07245 [Gammaproteobacteria bacterium]|nr:hypothetical protein [Gammaproteobacteria bacterium]
MKMTKSLTVLTLLGILSFSFAAFAQDTASQYYISASATSGGDGSLTVPFNSLRQAEAVSEEGDTIYLIASGEILDGGISLRSGQKLLGVDRQGRLITEPADRIKLTNTTDYQAGIIVQLAGENEVAGIHFLDMRGYGIAGANTNYSGAFIHHNSFSGNAQNHIVDERGLVYSISLNAVAGTIEDVRIEDSEFFDGFDLGAIRVFHSGASIGEYHFQRNSFSDLGGRAYFVRTRETSKVTTTILDSTASNLGHGGRNSDSIIPYLMGQSEQEMLVQNYQFENPKGVGSVSNTGIESYMFGNPRPDKANWCTACKLKFRIIDTVIKSAASDPIQFSNAGINSEMDLEIRNTQIIGGDPRQGGGGISVNYQPVENSGAKMSLLVENTDIVGTTGYGFSFNNRGGGNKLDAIVDFGGGELGSQGNNRIMDNEKGSIRMLDQKVTARNNYWGGQLPSIYNSASELAPNSFLEFEPLLKSAPQ